MSITEPINELDKAPQNAVENTQPAMFQLSLSPSIWWFKNFLSEQECEHLKAQAENKLSPSLIIDPGTGKSITGEGRSSRATFLPVGHDFTVRLIESRIATCLRMPVEHGEGLQILNYKIGQEYKAHHDYADLSLASTPKVLGYSGQRVASMLMYLSDVEEGGETVFPALNMRFKPEKGCALLFYNLHSNGIPDPNTLHASAPVIEGEKWVATKWVHERPYNAPHHQYPSGMGLPTILLKNNNE